MSQIKTGTIKSVIASLAYIRFPAALADQSVLQNGLRLYFHLILLKISEYDHTILAYMGILKNVRYSNKYFA